VGRLHTVHGLKVKVLITAFGQFPGVEVNPSGLLLKQIEKCKLPNTELAVCLLPVDYSYCESWISKVDKDYDLVIHIGVATKSVKNRVEIQAKNYSGELVDILGVAREGEIHQNGVSHISSSLSFEFLSQSHTLPLELSEDAGDYLCNFLYYSSLDRFRHRKVIFYHIVSETLISIDEQADLFKWLFIKTVQENF
jgi:pyroglutamyl-peptidase